MPNFVANSNKLLLFWLLFGILKCTYNKIAVSEFRENGEGQFLQDKLIQYDKARPQSSYIDGFWSEMYLKDMRLPLPINVNPFLQVQPVLFYIEFFQITWFSLGLFPK